MLIQLLKEYGVPLITQLLNTLISTGLDIPDVLDDNIYYDRTNSETNTKALRDFHNRYVKRN